MTDTESVPVDPRFGASMSEELAATESDATEIDGAETDRTETEGTEESASGAVATGLAMSGDVPGDERAEAVLLRVELDDVEAALQRLDAGTYGTCQVCGTEFADDVLERQPQIRLCPEHSG